MKKYLSALIAVLALLALPVATTVCSADRQISNGVGSTADGDYTNIEAEISSDTEMTFNNAVLSINGAPVPGAVLTVQGDNTTKVTLKFTGLNIKKGDKASVAWSLTQKEDNKWTTDAWFTPRSKSSALSPEDIPALGLRVTASGHVYLRNSRPFAIAYASLEIDFPSVYPTTSDLLDDLEIPPAGPMSGVVPPGSRATPGEAFIGNFPMQPGEYLTLKFDTEFDDPDQAGSTLEATNIVAHEHQADQIPTLTEWGLIIFGVVLIGFITWVFLRRSKPLPVKV